MVNVEKRLTGELKFVDGSKGIRILFETLGVLIIVLDESRNIYFKGFSLSVEQVGVIYRWALNNSVSNENEYCNFLIIRGDGKKIYLEHPKLGGKGKSKKLELNF